MTHDHVQTHAVQFSTHNWRRVPTPPPLTRLLRAHLRDFPAAPGGGSSPESRGASWHRSPTADRGPRPGTTPWAPPRPPHR